MSSNSRNTFKEELGITFLEVAKYSLTVGVVGIIVTLTVPIYIKTVILLLIFLAFCWLASIVLKEKINE